MSDDVQRSLGHIEGQLEQLRVNLEEHNDNYARMHAEMKTEISAVRKDLTEQIGKYPSRAEHDALTSQLQINTSAISKMEGKSGGLSQGWGWIVGIVGMASAIWGTFWNHHG